MATTLLASAAGAVKRSRWPSRVVRHNPVIQRPLVRLCERYDREPDRRAELRSRVLGRSLRWAATTAYGRAVAPTDPDAIGAWPILTKDELKADESRFVATSRLPTVGATTGGTTGLPLQLQRSLVSLNAEQFFLDRLLRAERVSFATSRIAVLRGDDVKDPSELTPPFGRYDNGGRRLVLSSAHLTGDTVGWYADELQRFTPDFLWAYPSTLSSLIRLLDAAARSVSIGLVVTSSEMLSPTESEQAIDRLGARIVDYYGQAERVALAADTGDGYRFEPLYGTVELRPAAEGDDPSVDGADGQLATAGITGTGHWNSAMPLVRYETGDSIRYRPDGTADQLDRIARGEIAFDGIGGRNSDYLISPDGGVLVGIDHLPRGLTGVLRMQVRQPVATEVQILVVTDSGRLGDQDRATLDASIGRKIPSSMSVTIDVVDELPRTPAGKTPFVVRAPELG
ncbi:MAG: hypothetical protein AAGA93_04655 [Actinomycetota bacterium]